MDAHGLPQVSSDTTGIHLSWSGPAAWLHAPDGFTVQRRVAQRLRAQECERFDAARIAHLAKVRELLLGFGVATSHLLSSDNPGGGIVIGPGSPLVVLRIDLDEDRRLVRVAAEAAVSFAVGYCDGRVVAAGLPQTGAATFSLRAARIDRVEVVIRGPKNLEVCVSSPDPQQASRWAGATTVASGLTLPLRELQPDLATPAGELAEARQRLLPSETIGEEEFRRLTSVLRPVVTAGPEQRPADLAVLLREEPDQDPDEVSGLDPLRIASAHPTWRRALGLGLLDDDPELVPGQTYEYRISATYPGGLDDPAYDLATVPSGTLLPADFAIGDLRLRLPRPTIVQLGVDPAGEGALRVTRRGIVLDPAREAFWLHPSLDEWSLVLDFAAPVTELVLDLAEGHDLVVASGAAAEPVDIAVPVPAGPMPRLVLPAPADQVRLRGTGFLHGIRVPSATGEKTEVSVVLAPITLADTPRPAAPRTARALNLQVPVTAGPRPVADVDARHDLGFRVSWRPALAFGLPGWLDQLDAAGPLEATTFEVERRREPDGPWVPVNGAENQTLGERAGGIRDLVLTPGADLRVAFPDDAIRTGGSAEELTLLDTFAQTGSDGANPPKPGTMHRFRVRAVDAIGRPGTNWRETDAVRLEKHRPPPLPVAVEARVLIRDADDLTPDERDLLGSSGTAIVLRWTWTAQQRDQDPFATEFRVYVARPLDRVTGTLDSETGLSGGTPRRYRLNLTLDRWVPAGLAAGGHLEAGHPFLIRSHSAGTHIEMIVETRLRLRDGTVPRPVAGPIELAVPLNPDRTRPDSWDERVETQPIGAATAYHVVLRDRLHVDQDTPIDALWVGVSAADGQDYVADQRTPAETRPGNESAVVPAQATARYAGRPTLEIPPPLEPVPQLRTPEPGSEPVHFPLDLVPHLPTAATATGRVRLERVSAVALASALAVTVDDRVLALAVEPPEPGDSDVEILLENPDDQALLVAALRSARTTEIPDHFLVHLAGRHPYRDRLFTPAREDPVSPGPVAQTLPPAAERWLYRVRAVDRAGRVSAGSATARVVVRVPSLLPGPRAERMARNPGDPPGMVRVRVPADETLTHVLTFQAPATGAGPIGEQPVLRVPNRPDLFPAGGLLLRAPGGELLSPTAASLDGPDVTTDADGGRRLAVTVTGGPGQRTRVWLATLTRDGVCSVVTGPFTLDFPAPELPVPVLRVTGPGPRFGWQWPPGSAPAASLLVAVERAVDDVQWSRVSPVLDPFSDGVTLTQPAGSWRYRLRVTAPDGRVAHSDPVTVA